MEFPVRTPRLKSSRSAIWAFFGTSFLRRKPWISVRSAVVFSSFWLHFLFFLFLFLLFTLFLFLSPHSTWGHKTKQKMNCILLLLVITLAIITVSLNKCSCSQTETKDQYMFTALFVSLHKWHVNTMKEYSALAIFFFLIQNCTLHYTIFKKAAVS